MPYKLNPYDPVGPEAASGHSPTLPPTRPTRASRHQRPHEHELAQMADDGGPVPPEKEESSGA